MQALWRIAACGNGNPAGAHNAARSAQMMHAANRFPAQHRAGRMNLHPQRPRLANIAKRQLERVYAHAIGLMQGARRLLIAYITLMQLFAAEYVRVITENLFHDTPFVFKKRDRKSTRLNSSHYCAARMPSSACKK